MFILENCCAGSEMNCERIVSCPRCIPVIPVMMCLKLQTEMGDKHYPITVQWEKGNVGQTTPETEPPFRQQTNFSCEGPKGCVPSHVGKCWAFIF